MASNKKEAVAQVDATKIYEMLHLMQGKSYIFRGKQLKVEAVSEVSDGYYVMTTVKNYTFTLENANAFIAECFPVESIQPSAAPAAMHPVEVVSREETMIDNMTDAMYEIFKQLRCSPTKDVIDQATAMSNTANTMTNMWKLKISAAKVLKR